MADKGGTQTTGEGDEIANQDTAQGTNEISEDPTSTPNIENDAEQTQEPEKTVEPEKETVDPKSVDWNTKDIDPFTNGNIEKAVDMLLLMSYEELNNLTYTDIATKDVIKAPWNYYGQKISGYAELVEAHPPGGDVSNTLVTY